MPQREDDPLEDDSASDAASLVLEHPPAPEAPISGLDRSTSFLAADDAGVVILHSKFVVVENFMRLLARDIKFNDFVREMLLLIMKVVKSEAGSILELDYASDEYFFRAVVGQSSDGLQKFRIPKGQGIVGYVGESLQSLVVPDMSESEIHLKAVATAVGFETRNLAAIPIVVRGKVYGVLELLNRVGEQNFTPEDLEILNYFCEMASRALEIRFMLSWANRAKTLGGEAA